SRFQLADREILSRSSDPAKLCPAGGDTAAIRIFLRSEHHHLIPFTPGGIGESEKRLPLPSADCHGGTERQSVRGPRRNIGGFVVRQTCQRFARASLHLLQIHPCPGNLPHGAIHFLRHTA